MKRSSVAAAILAALATFSGCGGDDDSSPAPTPTRSVAALADLVPAGAGIVTTPPPLGCMRDDSEIPTPRLEVCVLNQGDGAARPFHVDELAFPALAPGARACLTTFASSGGGATVFVDDRREVAESNENNNEQSYPFGIPTRPQFCTTTPTPTETPTPRFSEAFSLCYEQVECAPFLYASPMSKESCCARARQNTLLPISWCPQEAVDPRDGSCSACAGHPCTGIPEYTPTPTPPAE